MYTVNRMNPLLLQFQIIDVNEITKTETNVNLNNRILTYILKRPKTDINSVFIQRTLLPGTEQSEMEDFVNGLFTIQFSSKDLDIEETTYLFEVRTEIGTGDNKIIFTHLQDKILITPVVIEEF